MITGSNSTGSQNANSMWAAALSKPTTTKYKSKKTDVIHHPEFYEAIAHTDDLYWRDILYNCARAKFPRNFIYMNWTMRYRPKDTYINLMLAPREFCISVICFIREQAKIYSPTDIEQLQRNAESQILESMHNKPETWTTVASSQKRKALYVKDYVEKNFSESSQELRDHLFNLINIGFATGYLKKNHITFTDGAIVNIDGYIVEGETVRLTRATPKTKGKKKKEVSYKPKIYYHYDNWVKFLRTFEKKVQNNVKSSLTKTSYNTTEDASLDDRSTADHAEPEQGEPSEDNETVAAHEEQDDISEESDVISEE